ncbi:hypothetical protein CGGC5_v017076 [Colletotrichum fructicola Nara gc5]|uniref:Uncharacterized protein n=1 Tax=Colletotrichum fructicola (strain Nara gc5) TaxID=1213859 RepID=A0A7J6IEC0_COLFN|nr:hypothetical protein CGGC5_v017076 [Colletotrichum fructicola Nara gc5]
MLSTCDVRSYAFLLPDPHLRIFTYNRHVKCLVCEQTIAHKPEPDMATRRRILSGKPLCTDSWSIESQTCG